MSWTLIWAKNEQSRFAVRSYIAYRSFDVAMKVRHQLSKVHHYWESCVRESPWHLCIMLCRLRGGGLGTMLWGVSVLGITFRAYLGVHEEVAAECGGCIRRQQIRKTRQREIQVKIQKENSYSSGAGNWKEMFCKQQFGTILCICQVGRCRYVYTVTSRGQDYSLIYRRAVLPKALPASYSWLLYHRYTLNHKYLLMHSAPECVSCKFVNTIVMIASDI